MKYWFYLNGEISGPYSSEELISNPNFSMDSMLCQSTLSGTSVDDWKRADSFEEFKYYSNILTEEMTYEEKDNDFSFFSHPNILETMNEGLDLLKYENENIFQDKFEYIDNLDLKVSQIKEQVETSIWEKSLLLEKIKLKEKKEKEYEEKIKKLEEKIKELDKKNTFKEEIYKDNVKFKEKDNKDEFEELNKNIELLNNKLKEKLNKENINKESELFVEEKQKNELKRNILIEEEKSIKEKEEIKNIEELKEESKDINREKKEEIIEFSFNKLKPSINLDEIKNERMIDDIKDFSPNEILNEKIFKLEKEEIKREPLNFKIEESNEVKDFNKLNHSFIPEEIKNERMIDDIKDFTPNEILDEKELKLENNFKENPIKSKEEEIKFKNNNLEIDINKKETKKQITKEEALKLIPNTGSLNILEGFDFQVSGKKELIEGEVKKSNLDIKKDKEETIKENKVDNVLVNKTSIGKEVPLTNNKPLIIENNIEKGIEKKVLFDSNITQRVDYKTLNQVFKKENKNDNKNILKDKHKLKLSLSLFISLMIIVGGVFFIYNFKNKSKKLNLMTSSSESKVKEDNIGLEKKENINNQEPVKENKVEQADINTSQIKNNLGENTKKAIEIVKNYPLSDGRGNISLWFSNSFSNNKQVKEEWSSTLLQNNVFVVQYRLLRQKQEPIVYQFEVNVDENKIIRGINNNAIELLESQFNKIQKEALKKNKEKKYIAQKTRKKITPLPSRKNEEDIPTGFENYESFEKNNPIKINAVENDEELF